MAPLHLKFIFRSMRAGCALFNKESILHPQEALLWVLAKAPHWLVVWETGADWRVIGRTVCLLRGPPTLGSYQNAPGEVLWRHCRLSLLMAH